MIRFEKGKKYVFDVKQWDKDHPKEMDRPLQWSVYQDFALDGRPVEVMDIGLEGGVLFDRDPRGMYWDWIDGIDYWSECGEDNTHWNEPWAYDWASYRAVDSDGDIEYHEIQPRSKTYGWSSGGRCGYLETGGGFDCSDWRNSLQTKADYDRRKFISGEQWTKEEIEKMEKKEPLQGTYEAKGVKFPAVVEVKVNGKWRRRTGLAIDVDGYLQYFSINVNMVNDACEEEWRPIQLQRVDKDDLKKRAYLVGGVV